MKIRFDGHKVFLVSVLVVLLLSSAGVFVLCRPFFKAMTRDKNQEKAYAQEVLFLRNILGARKTDGVFAQLILKEKIPLFMAGIHRLAEKNGVVVTLAKPPFVAGYAKKEVFARVFFEIQVLASLRDLGVFLTAARNMPEGLLDIDSLRVRPDEAAAGKVTAAITFILFVVKDNARN